ncbi:MAG: type II toxin-antitoxin system RelE family toxin [bacterium]
MNYNVFLSRKATKQYNNLDHHIQNKIKSILSELKQDPTKGFSLTGKKYIGLKYIKISHKNTEYRAVYDICDAKQEVLVIFLGTRENFYKELRRYLG